MTSTKKIISGSPTTETIQAKLVSRTALIGNTQRRGTTSRHNVEAQRRGTTYNNSKTDFQHATCTLRVQVNNFSLLQILS